MNQKWWVPLIVAHEDGPSLSNSLTATSILPATAKCVIPLNSMDIGSAFHVRAFGRISNIVTTPGTLTLDVKFGSVAAFSTGALQLSTTAHTTIPWMFEADLIVRSLGATSAATIFGLGRFTSLAASLTATTDNVSTDPVLLGPAGTPTVGTGFDSTVDNQIDLYATFSVNNIGNLIQLHGYSFSSLN